MLDIPTSTLWTGILMTLNEPPYNRPVKSNMDVITFGICFELYTCMHSGARCLIFFIIVMGLFTSLALHVTTLVHCDGSAMLEHS